jgi:hypothetical protein
MWLTPGGRVATGRVEEFIIPAASCLATVYLLPRVFGEVETLNSLSTSPCRDRHMTGINDLTSRMPRVC